MGNEVSIFTDKECFGSMWRAAQAFSASAMVPAFYQGKPENCLVAMSIAHDLGKNPFTVMNHLNSIHGRHSWSAAWCTAGINECGLYRGAIQHETEELGEKIVDGIKINDARRKAVLICAATGKSVNGPWVSYEMAIKEKWWTRNGSKWQTMPDLMLTYRANAFFARTNCPQVLMGMLTQDEAQDIEPIDVTPRPSHKKAKAVPASTVEEIDDGIPFLDAAPVEPSFAKKAFAAFEQIKECGNLACVNEILSQNDALFNDFKKAEPERHSKMMALIEKIQADFAEKEAKTDTIIENINRMTKLHGLERYLEGQAGALAELLTESPEEHKRVTEAAEARKAELTASTTGGE